ncbi:hypothetical protein Leryth_004785 [Lithospermum erythrorhizon]|nr:hypothetical protein Leryth_004785 [Lithospermum erythrorhizon]
MGHRSGNGALHIPKFLVYTLTILGIITEIISSFLIYIILGLMPSLEPEHEPSSHIQENQTHVPLESPLSAVLIRELLPEATFAVVVCSNGGGGGDEQLSHECVICLYEFKSDQEIRCLKNCQHFFHRDCIDRWMDQNKNTCPLCRKSLVPMDSRKEYDHRLWQALCSDDYMYYEDEYLHTQRTTQINFD